MNATAVNSINMDIAYREGNIDDVNGLRELAIKSWAQYRAKLTSENWTRLSNTLNDDKTYIELIEKSKGALLRNQSFRPLRLQDRLPSLRIRSQINWNI